MKFEHCERAGLKLWVDEYQTDIIHAKDVEAYLATLTKYSNYGLDLDKYSFITKMSEESKKRFHKATEEAMTKGMKALADAQIMGYGRVEVPGVGAYNPAPESIKPEPRDNGETMEFFKPGDFVSEGVAYKSIADRANHLLKERGTVVYGTPDETHLWDIYPSGDDDRLDFDDTHTALLINIQPIAKEDTAEGLLRELIDWDQEPKNRSIYGLSESLKISERYDSFISRAKKILEKAK